MSKIISLSYEIHEEDGEFVGVCKELDVATQADNGNEAEERLIEAIDLHISVLEEAGELSSFLEERGISSFTISASSSSDAAPAAVIQISSDNTSWPTPVLTWDTERPESTYMLQR